MKTVEYLVKCNTKQRTYTIICQDPTPIYHKYDGVYTSISAMMKAVLTITNELRKMNVKAVFHYEY